MFFAHSLAVDIRAPQDDVWRVVADYTRDAEWREGVTIAHEPRGLVQNGTRTYEKLKMLGSWHSTEATISDVRTGSSFRFVSIDGRVVGTRSLETNAQGTRVTLSIRVSPPAPLSWLAPLLGRLFRRRVQRDLERLRQLIEATAASRSEGLLERDSLLGVVR